jgi:hypothetical protein
VPQTSPVCQLELSADIAGKRGVESEGQNAETAEQAAELLSRALEMLLPKVSTRPTKAERGFCGGVKRGRDTLPVYPELVAFLFCSPSSLRLCSKRMAA